VKDDKEYVAINPQIFVHPMDKWHLQSEWKKRSAYGRAITVRLALWHHRRVRSAARMYKLYESEHSAF
jgi:hypothetical protein